MWQFLMMEFNRYIRALMPVFVIAVVIAMSALQAHAQTTISLRAGDHDDYTRLVFDWPQATNYEISQSGEMLSLQFDKAAGLDTASVNQEEYKNVGTINVTSPVGQNLAVAIQINDQSKFRHFKIGSRVVVDIYDAPGQIKKTPVEKPVTVKSNEVTQVDGDVPAPAEEKLEPPKKIETKEPVKEEPKKPAEAKVEELAAPPVEQMPLTDTEPHVITLTSTRSVGMAAFERAGYVWLVFDDPTLKTTPVIAGPQKDKFPELKKIKFDGGIAYRIPQPEGYLSYGEGGGLLWRIVITPNPRRTEPTLPKVTKLNSQDYAGGTILWPFKSARKILTLHDDLVGDDITVITTEGSEEFAGPARQYVELEVLPSTVGLAFVAKADDVVAKKTREGIEVSTPQGLIVSSSEDTALAELKDDIEKEEESFEKEDKTEHIKRIFDFNRWEMGGMQALANNRQILMRGLSAKQDASKVEDIITLAKLNLANAQGPEALGLMNLAALLLPGVDEDPEFVALRGASEALSRQFDEALDDLSIPTLEEYTERDYWRAFTLAGLEDWQQAEEVMPTDFDIFDSYPMPLQKLLLLALSEISLRAGKPEQAEELLARLEPEFSKMSGAQQAAWKYLKGELERQQNDPEKAIENWQSLASGKDEYFRAKAGLSLTKLQLDSQKITPAKAIDRLEGLRYAWRGDELETLINYRLGEVYIQNNDYLKGLSVLRNAVAFSPDTPLAREVAQYLSDTFRKLFTDGTLKNISPIDAVTIYDEFKELTPPGEEGEIFVQNLAERLVDIDLLGRASDLLKGQLDHRLTGELAAKVAIRLAAIQLLDSRPDDALVSLERASQEISKLSGSQVSSKTREVKLLKARALSKVNRASDGLAILKTMPKDEDVTRLRADIAWNASRWDEAAEAFKDLISDANISSTRPPEDYETNLVINRAIALNLAGNRTALAEFRDKYKTIMEQTGKAKIFDLVTRPRQLGMLDSRDSIASLISEVDLFGEFLESYKKAQ